MNAFLDDDVCTAGRRAWLRKERHFAGCEFLL